MAVRIRTSGSDSGSLPSSDGDHKPPSAINSPLPRVPSSKIRDKEST